MILPQITAAGATGQQRRSAAAALCRLKRTTSINIHDTTWHITVPAMCLERSIKLLDQTTAPTRHLMQTACITPWDGTTPFRPLPIRQIDMVIKDRGVPIPVIHGILWALKIYIPHIIALVRLAIHTIL